MKKSFGIFAHVDAGKTTFSEQVLFKTHTLRKPGRVDHKDTFLDMHPIEKQRGITVFSDQAYFNVGEDTWYWLDTPGHTDFVGEMERVIPVIDYAVLIVSAAEGVQSHTETLWNLLKEYNKPVFIFLNKLDRTGADPVSVISAMKRRLSNDILDMREGLNSPLVQEAVAGYDLNLMERYFEGEYDEALWTKSLTNLIKTRSVFPLFAGAALLGTGIDELLSALNQFTSTDYKNDDAPVYSVYKVRRDKNGTRLTYLKVLSGTIKVKQEIITPFAEGKISAMYLIEGGKTVPVNEAQAGDLVAAAGLSGTKSGDIISNNPTRGKYVCEPMMITTLIPPAGVSPTELLSASKIIEDEEPALKVNWNDRHKTIELIVMGNIQLEVLKEIYKDRFGLDVGFGPCRVRYKETIKTTALGIGHYEPLRHYAEAQLRLSPGAPGSGITYESKLHVDKLALNWQRLIETHVFEKEHKGVLTGSPITDIHIELMAGASHLKHTEGGDFRQAVYRAIRNGLMQTKSVLLEPVCEFGVRFDESCLGKIIGDLNGLEAQITLQEFDAGEAIIKGFAPLSGLSNYQVPFLAATHGKGTFSYKYHHMEEVKNQEAVIAEFNYNPLADDTPDSVFCSHGAGFTVNWQEVKNYAHCSFEEK